MQRVVIFSVLAGIVGTGIGGLLSALIKRPNRNFIGLSFAFAGGIMLGISMLHLTVGSIEFGGVFATTINFVVGVAIILLIRRIMNGNDKECSISSKEAFRKTGLFLFVVIAIHDFPEGMAIGAGDRLDFGLATAIGIGLHNIPEGLSIGIALKASGRKSLSILGICLLAGTPTAIGGILGYCISVNTVVLALCLGLTAGAMTAVSFTDLIPQANDLLGCQNIKLSLSVSIGIVISILMLLL